MSSDAKVWKDNEGWHAVADFIEDQLDMSEYDLSELLEYVEEKANQPLNWEIFQFGDGLGLRGYRAR